MSRRYFIPSGPISRRSFLKGSAGVAVGAAALGSRAVHSRARQGFSGSLTVWGVVSFTPEGDELLGQQMRDWGEANGVEVEYVALPGSDYNTRLATAIEANAVPDIAMMLENAGVLYAGQGRLVDLTDIWNSVKDLAGGVYEVLTAGSKVGEQMFSLPFEADVSVMYARLDLCEQVLGERRAPTTYDELEQVAREVTESPRQFGIGLTLGRVPDAVGQINNIMFADGGTLVDQAGQPAINNPGTISALTRIKRWWDDGLIPPDATSWDDSSNNRAYQSRQAAFVFNPASIFAYLEENDPELLADTAQAPLPAGTAGSFGTAGAWAWGLFSASQNQEAAKALLSHIMQPEQLGPVYEAVGGRWYPIYRDLANSEFWASRPLFKDFPTIIESSRPIWYPAETSALLISQLSAASQRLLSADMAQDVVVNGMSPEEAAARAQERYVQSFEETAASMGA